MTVDQLEESGLMRMNEEEIDGFLASQGFGVLGLQNGDMPYMLPMSFGYGDGDYLYFTFVVGEGSRKDELTEQNDRAVFLVYQATTAFQWQSVLLTGDIGRLPAHAWDDFEGVMRNAWRPDIFKKAEVTDAKVYRFEIQEQRGYRHTGLPPGFVQEE